MERNQKKTECQKKAGDAIEVSMEREVDQNKKKEQEATACTEERYWEWLCSVPRLYYPLRALLLEQFGGPGNIYDASEKAASLLCGVCTFNDRCRKRDRTAHKAAQPGADCSAGA